MSIYYSHCSESNIELDDGSGGNPPTGDLIILTPDHTGWGRGDCFHCHPADNLSSSHDGLYDERVCQGCHGENGTGSGIRFCTTCHGNPPVSGAHVHHYSVISGVLTCEVCHSSSGPSSPNHRNSVVDVALDPAYGGIWNGMSCSAVSCHGCGTPVWYEDKNLDCGDCHSITCGAFNDIGSGNHNIHLSRFNA